MTGNFNQDKKNKKNMKERYKQQISGKESNRFAKYYNMTIFYVKEKKTVVIIYNRRKGNNLSNCHKNLNYLIFSE